MPAVRRASFPLLLLVAMVFVGGIGFGAVAALTSPRKEVAKATTPDTTAATETRPTTEPAPTPTTAKAEPTRKAEPKPEPKPKPTTAKPEKKPDPPKPTEPKPKPTEPKPEPPKGEAISYVKQVFPIFKAKCLMCHGDPQKKADVDLRTLASAVKGGSSGDGAVPGKPDKSSLWLAIEDGSMPPAGKEKLTDAEKKLVKDWILSGAK
jgi:type IV secretory pathway VirB10-like protein